MITMSLSTVSLSGTALIRFYLGTSGGSETSGYGSASSVIAAGAVTVNQTAGFDIYTNAPSAAYAYSGSITFTRMNTGGTLWAAYGVFANTSVAWTHTVAGIKSLSSALTTVAISSSNGSDTFDLGNVNVRYS
jgi:hypothetical protein